MKYIKGDWVWVRPFTGFYKHSDERPCEIIDDKVEPCLLCDDSSCVEYPTLWMAPNDSGQRIPLYHVSECKIINYYYK